MKLNCIIRYFVCFVLAFTVLFPVILKAEEASLDKLTVVMVDTSKSMEGYGDGQGIRIFSKIKDTTVDIANSINSGSRLMIFPFDRVVGKVVFNKIMIDEKDKAEAKQFVSNLKAEGIETYLTKSFQYVVDFIKKELENNPNRNNIVVEIMILTDGRGNGLGDKDLKEFIRIFNLTKTDYPHLLTKFLCVGDIFTESEKKQLEDGKIDITTITKDPQTYNVVVKPKEIVFNWSKPEFEITFDYPPEAEGKIVNVQINIETDKDFKDQFQILPRMFALSKSQLFVIKTENPNVLEEIKKKDSFKMSGTIRLTGDKLVFFPNRDISFQSNYELKKITMVWESQPLGKNAINITAMFKSNFTFSDQMFMKFIVDPDQKDVPFSLTPVDFTWKGENFTSLTLKPSDQEKFDRYVKKIKEETNLTFTILLQLPNSDFRIENASYKVSLKVLPNKEKTVFYLFGCIFGLLLLLIAIRATKKKKTANFQFHYLMNMENGEKIYLKGKYGKSKLTIGNTKKADIRINVDGFEKGIFFSLEPFDDRLYIKKVDKIFTLSVNNNISTELDIHDRDAIEVSDNNNLNIRLVAY